MAEMKIPIVVDIEEIKEYLNSNDIVKVVRCKDCKYYKSYYDKYKSFYA